MLKIGNLYFIAIASSSLAAVILNVGCTPIVTIKSDPILLQEALVTLPSVERHVANVNFENYVSATTSENLIPARTTEFSGARVKLEYPRTEMLNDAGKASVLRWFKHDRNIKKSFVVMGKIEDLYYRSDADFGVGRSVVKVKLFATLEDVNGRAIKSGNYESGLVRGEWWSALFGVAEKEQRDFNILTYKAMLLAFDEAMKDFVQHIKEN